MAYSQCADTSDPGAPTLSSAAGALAHDVIRFEEIDAVWQRGEIRQAVKQLLHLEQDASASALQRARAALRLAEGHARLGLSNDASEWLAAAQSAVSRIGDMHAQSLFDAAHASLLHWSGHEVHAIRAANTALGRHSRRATDPERHQLLHVLGNAYLRLGQIVKAEQCVAAMLAPPVCTAAFLLLGEIKLWSIVRQHPAFRGQLLLADELVRHPAPREGLVRDALSAYQCAVESARPGTLARRSADIGLVMARLAGEDSGSDWHQLEAHIAWLHQHGLRYECDLARLHLGMLLLLHKRASPAKLLLVPLANRAVARDGAPLEYDALFFASVACAESGDDRAALNYLNSYNVRIREQHLSRATVPPPNLDSPDRRAPGATWSRRRGDSAQQIVDHVKERLRIAPADPMDSRQLAQLAGVSRRTLETSFRRITGYAPKEFATRIRLAEFENRRALIDCPTPAKLDELARGIGFSSYRALSRCAKRLAPLNADQIERLTR
jgi:AraC-like DNA-binding protein